MPRRDRRIGRAEVNAGIGAARRDGHVKRTTSSIRGRTDIYIGCAGRETIQSKCIAVQACLDYPTRGVGRYVVVGAAGDRNVCGLSNRDGRVGLIERNVDFAG